MPGRESGGFDESLTTERTILRKYLAIGEEFETEVKMVGPANRKNQVPDSELGTYRPASARKLATADVEIISEFIKADRPLGMSRPWRPWVSLTGSAAVESSPAAMATASSPRVPTQGVHGRGLG